MPTQLVSLIDHELNSIATVEDFRDVLYHHLLHLVELRLDAPNRVVIQLIKILLQGRERRRRGEERR